MTTGYRCVLIAVDASDDADAVLRCGLEIDPRGGDRCHVVVVVPLLSVPTGAGAAVPTGDLDGTIVREVQEGTRERAARFGIPPERVTVLRGRPATEIHAHARALGADLIAVGSHGRRGLPRLMLGSTAAAVQHDAPCDVLTIRLGD